MTALTRYAGFWPGLPALWQRGMARGLLVSVLFSWSICVLLLATFVWTEWLAGWFLITAWTALGGYWCIEFIRSQWVAAVGVGAGSIARDDATLIAAQHDYLQGNWFDAEAKLLPSVEKDPDDIPASLLLIGVLRHTQRYRAALRRLEQLCLLDAAHAWSFEIHREKQLLEKALKNEELVADDQDESPMIATP